MATEPKIIQKNIEMFSAEESVNCSLTFLLLWLIFKIEYKFKILLQDILGTLPCKPNDFRKRVRRVINVVK
jgi:hypothetical protein